MIGDLNELSTVGINTILLNHWKNKGEGFSDTTGGGGRYLKNKLVTIDEYEEKYQDINK